MERILVCFVGVIFVLLGSVGLLGASSDNVFAAGATVRDCAEWIKGGMVEDSVAYFDGTSFEYINKEICSNSNLLKICPDVTNGWTECAEEHGDDIISSTTESENGETDDGGEGGKEAADCMNSGAAGTLGWIVCPILNWLGDAAEGIYNEYVKPALQVEPVLFTGGDNATYNGWETFRNIGNGLIIILLLFVIFSQVTGVGIDNYGIKKVLPKLIVAAILMNLLYWICIIAVDLSNILGNGLQALFDGLAGQVAPGGNVEVSSIGASVGSTVVSVGILAAFIVSTGMAALSAAGSPGAVLLMLFVGAISVLVSIITLFIVLSARQAAIVILVVLSPLAMVCYMLPNTKGLFDKWVRFMQSLLLVYPIAGLLVGGGNYVSVLLLSAGFGNSLFGALTAMIVGIIPIFFIPSVLKRSLAFAGDIGNKVSGVGRNVGRRYTGNLDRGVRSSEAFKRYQERAANQRRVNSARKVNARMRNKQNRGRTLTAKEQDAMGQAQKVLAAQRSRENENRNLSDVSYLQADRRKQDLQNENARRDVLMYNNADVVTSTLTKAENQRRQQLVEAHDWSNVAHVAAMENKQDTQHEIAEGELMLHLNPVVNQAEINKAGQQIHQKLNEAGNWTDDRYIQGQQAKSDLATEDDLKRTRMYSHDDFVEGTRKQQRMQRGEAYDNAVLYTGEDGNKLVRAEMQKSDNARAMKIGEARVGVRPVDVAESEKLFGIQRNTQMMKDFQSRLQTGGINEDGTTGAISPAAVAAGIKVVNGNDMSSVGKFYEQAIRRYNAATTQEQRDTAMTQVQAAQNILSQNDKGRTQISDVLTRSVTDAAASGTAGADAGARMAASHLQTNYAETFKQKDRGTGKMIEELASNVSLSDIDAKARAGSTAPGRYSTFGVEKYSPQALANADDRVIDRFIANVGTMSAADQAVLKGTINDAFDARSKGTLQMKPEVATKLTNLRSMLP
ncbi:hypothetical protein IKE87_01075 [Candidatus Saccharibacteria bacterium]|nr:hypothetical protein [Candidatus Saccharibacteria bacterium]